ncbi:FecR domain-containing protein [Geobacter pelophilus]|uniref:FecR domain-containing protein n=1 Tax=Geoanaerobacter pelophilus TaxID=60036 RepID=A0AAW4L2F0_9BACT|nr:FecR family protein [Geoanaerobacter pelophilus]MBT0665053.1 FecR domain-containing protein [Geoanaerobacter pelophilus]
MKRLLAIAVVLFITIVPLYASASSGLARLSLTKGEVLLFDDDSNDWVPTTANTPVEEGDRIWCANGARAEIELQNGSILRLGSKTSIDIVRLDNNEQQVYLSSGRLYARTFEADRDLQINSDDATISVGRKSRVHIDLVGSGDPDTEVSVVKGTVYVESVSGKTRVKSGETLLFSENGAEVAPLNPPDQWEQWNEKRDRTIFKRKAANRYLPEELVIYEEELASNGEWVPIEEYGYAWRPTIAVGVDWTPYQQGRWVWRRGSYVWIASEPWGWAPHHYGRWQYSQRYGWCWLPPRRGDVYWSPGYVAWVDTQSDLAWVPLAPGEIYYGYGNYGSLSINITNVDRRTVIRPITNYRNLRVRNAVTVIERNAFTSGRGAPRQGRPAGLERYQGLTAPPQTRPAAREARMPLVRKIAPESRPPASVIRSHPAPLKERFPRLEPERRRVAPERKTEPLQVRPTSPADRHQAPQQRVVPAPQAKPAGTPITEQPAQERRRREPVQPAQQPVPARTEQQVKPEARPASGESRSEGRKADHERQPRMESKPATTTTPRPETRQGQPRRVWQIAPRETPKETSKETAPVEKQEPRQRRER